MDLFETQTDSVSTQLLSASIAITCRHRIMTARPSDAEHHHNDTRVYRATHWSAVAAMPWRPAKRLRNSPDSASYSRISSPQAR